MLKNQNFKYLWFGRLSSNAGDSIYYIVLSWYILQTTNSSFWVGILNFAIFIPNIFSFLFGHFIDSHDNKKTLIFCELGQLIAISILACTVYFEAANPLLTCIIVFFAALFGMNTYTIQDTMMPKIVPKKDLTRAQSYMSFAYNGTEYFFNAITGFLINIMSTFSLLLVNCITFIISIGSFSRIKTEKEAVASQKDSSFKKNIFKGFSLILKERAILCIAVGGSIANFLFGGLNVYIVLIADAQNSPVILGLMTASMAVGALIGSTLGATFILKVLPHGKALVLCTLLFGVGIVICATVVSSVLVTVVFGIANIFLGVTHVLQKPYFQVLLPKEDLGKVFSALFSVSVGTLPIGALFFGAIAGNLNAFWFLILFGVIYIAIALLYMFNKKVFHFELSEE
ncbi:MFS transporter [Listeria booriae]|uniref:MFS transporter n=1 Tax=Listeria booriae TaxID=1552123 RepID=UPI00162AD98A|nr:MFS transporter [Listeria booriae]MBC2265006.1 MFS transporter [Listeria booriae]